MPKYTLSPKALEARRITGRNKSLLSALSKSADEAAKVFVSSWKSISKIGNKNKKSVESQNLINQFPQFVARDDNNRFTVKAPEDLNVVRILARKPVEPENRIIALLRKNAEAAISPLIPSPENSNPTTDTLTYKVVSSLLEGVRSELHPIVSDFEKIQKDADFIGANRMALIYEFYDSGNISTPIQTSSNGNAYFLTPGSFYSVKSPIDYGMNTNLFSPNDALEFYKRSYKDYSGRKNTFFRLYREEILPRPFQLFDSIESNCVLDIIEDYILKNRDYLKKSKKIADPMPIFNEIKSEIMQENTGFMHKHAEIVYSKLHLKLRIYHNNGLWYSKESNSNHKILSIFAHDKHASQYQKIEKLKKVEYVLLNDDGHVTIEHHAPANIYGKLHANPHTDHETGITTTKFGFSVSAYHVKDTIYKSFRPQSPDDANPDYFSCVSDLSYEFKKWKLTNLLRTPEEPYFSLIKNASHLIASMKVSDNTKFGDMAYHTDINKAYPSFKTNSLYEKFKLPLGCYNFGVINDSPINIVSTTGWSIIDNVKFNHPLLEKINYIQNNNIYTHVRLFHLLSKGLATFTISSTITSRGEDVNMPFRKLNTDENKKYNVAFVGMLIASNAVSTKHYVANDKSELLQIQYDASKEANYIESHILDDKTIEIRYKNESKKQLYNIHTYIVDYAQVTLINAMCDNYDKEILCYHTDGFFTKARTDIENSNEWGKFKNERKEINYISKSKSQIHKLEQNLIPEFKPIIAGSIDTITIGPPGSGKSRQMFTNVFYSNIITCPTHKLKNTLKKSNRKFAKSSENKNPRIFSTFHKYFDIFAKTYERKHVIFENVYIDECSMITKSNFDKILKFARDNRINVHFIGDIDKNGIYQLPPVVPPKYQHFENQRSLNLDDFSDNGFVVIKTENSENRRQNATDCQFLDNLRDKDYETQLEFMRNRVTKIEINDITKIDAVGIVATHARANLLNEIMFKFAISNKKSIILRSTVNKKEKGEVIVAKGELITISYDEYQKNKETYNKKIYRNRKHSSDVAPAGTTYELGYFNTCDSVQGDTICGNIIVDLVGANRENLLYTAITRATDLNNVYYIDL